MNTFSTLKGIGIAIVVFLLLSFTIFNRINGSGNIVKEERSVSTFNCIEAGGAFEIIIVKGDQQSLIIETDDNIIDRIVSEVRNGELELHTNGNINNVTKMVVYITMAELKDIDLSGAASLTSESRFENDDMDFELSGASSSDLKIKCNKLDVDISGAANINLSGYAANIDLECSGASNFKAFELEADDAKIDCSGASNVKISVTKSLIGEASGASSITYKGNPAKVDVRTSGASDINRKKILF